MLEDDQKKITHEEYKLLKKYSVLHPKNLMNRPMPPNDIIKNLIGKGLMTEITRPEAKSRTPPLIIGYEVTDEGIEMITYYEKKNFSS